MKKIRILLSFLLYAFALHAQVSLHTHDEQIRSLRVLTFDQIAEGVQLTPQRPFLLLTDGVVNGSDAANTLHISFDQMSHDVHFYTYTVEHMNAEWSEPSGLLSSEYLSGFTTQDITAYEHSLNTMRIYTHYEFVFPNSDMQLTKSGNYRLFIYEDGNRDNRVAEVDFCVVEPVVRIDTKVRSVKVPENVDNSMLASGKIAHKDLYFCEGVQRQIDTFANLISEQHYNDICARLKEKGLRQGFACLFYGAPGTGKTESVLQLARQSGRDIMQVNVSEIKDKWVGESEKNIKAVFDRYRALVRQSKRAPILLFNEADAIIGKRLTNVSRSVDKMENAMQNIILQEMESLEGIMIATTNLEENMDGAFERRFLYKVRFEKPEAEQRCHIWQSLLPTLPAETAMMLASKYDFSGGQIENIARKCGVESVLYGDDAVTEELIDRFCSEEFISKKGVKIGFCA